MATWKPACNRFASALPSIVGIQHPLYGLLDIDCVNEKIDDTFRKLIEAANLVPKVLHQLSNFVGFDISSSRRGDILQKLIDAISRVDDWNDNKNILTLRRDIHALLLTIESDKEPPTNQNDANVIAAEAVLLDASALGIAKSQREFFDLVLRAADQDALLAIRYYVDHHEVQLPLLRIAASLQSNLERLLIEPTGGAFLHDPEVLSGIRVIGSQVVILADGLGSIWIHGRPEAKLVGLIRAAGEELNALGAGRPEIIRTPRVDIANHGTAPFPATVPRDEADDHVQKIIFDTLLGLLKGSIPDEKIINILLDAYQHPQQNEPNNPVVAFLQAIRELRIKPDVDAVDKAKFALNDCPDISGMGDVILGDVAQQRNDWQDAAVSYLRFLKNFNNDSNAGLLFGHFRWEQRLGKIGVDVNMTAPINEIFGIYDTIAQFGPRNIDFSFKVTSESDVSTESEWLIVSQGPPLIAATEADAKLAILSLRQHNMADFDRYLGAYEAMARGATPPSLFAHNGNYALDVP